MSRKPGILRQVITNFKNSLFSGVRRTTLVGIDQYGNKYFEQEGDPKRNLRATRYIEESKNLGPYDVPEVPVEWEAWLRGRRYDPPTSEEIEKNYKYMLRTKFRADEIDKNFGSSQIPASTADSQAGAQDIARNTERSSFPTYKEYEVSPGEFVKKKTEQGSQ